MANNPCDPSKIDEATQKADSTNDLIDQLDEVIKAVHETVPAPNVVHEVVEAASLKDVANLSDEALASLPESSMAEVKDLPAAKEVFERRHNALWSKITASDGFRALSKDQQTMLENGYKYSVNNKSAKFTNYEAARNALDENTRNMFDAALNEAYYVQHGKPREFMFTTLLRQLSNGWTFGAREAYYSSFFNGASLMGGARSSIKLALTKMIDRNYNRAIWNKQTSTGWRAIAEEAIKGNRVNKTNNLLLSIKDTQVIEASGLNSEIKQAVLQARDSLNYSLFWDSVEKTKLKVTDDVKAVLEKAFGKAGESPAHRNGLEPAELDKLDKFLNTVKDKVTRDYFHAATRDVHLQKVTSGKGWEAILKESLGERKAGEVPVSEFMQMLDSIPAQDRYKAIAARLLDDGAAIGGGITDQTALAKLLQNPISESSKLSDMLSKLGGAKIKEYRDMLASVWPDGVTKKIDDALGLSDNVDEVEVFDVPKGGESQSIQAKVTEIGQKLKAASKGKGKKATPQKEAAEQAAQEDLEKTVDVSQNLDESVRADYPELRSFNREKIAAYNADEFNNELTGLVEKCYESGRSAEPVVKAYTEALFVGTKSNPGLHSKVTSQFGRLGERAFSQAEKDWWKKLGSTSGQKRTWDAVDGKMLVGIYNKADADSQAKMMSYIFAGMIKKGALWLPHTIVKHPLWAAGAAMTLWTAPGMIGFMLEEGFQAYLQYGATNYGTGIDDEASFFATKMSTYKAIQDIWRPFAKFVEAHPTLMFPSWGVNYFLTGPAQRLMEDRATEYKRQGVMKDSTDGCFQTALGTDFCPGIATTRDERVEFILAHPEYLEGYTPEMKKYLLGKDAGGTCDPTTGVCENNIWARKLGMIDNPAYTSQDRIQAGQMGLLDINQRGANSAWNDFGDVKSFAYDTSKLTDSIVYKDIETKYGGQISALANSAKQSVATWYASDQPIALTPPDSATGQSTAQGGVPGTIPNTPANAAYLALDANDLVSNCMSYGGTGLKSECVSFLNNFHKEDGSVDFNLLLAKYPDMTYGQARQLFSNEQDYNNGIKQLIQAKGLSVLPDLISQGAVEAKNAAAIIPDGMKKDFVAYNADPRNFGNSMTFTPAGGLSWVDLTGYSHTEDLVRSDGLVYNPVTGMWDNQIPGTRYDANGSTFKLDSGKYALFLQANGIRNMSPGQIQSFLASDPYNMTYQKSGSSSSGKSYSSGYSSGYKKSYSSGGGYKKSYTPYKKNSYGTYSKTEKATGINVHAQDAEGNEISGQVYEDGQLIGNTGENIETSSGDHTFVISAEGYQDKDLTANIYDGSMYNKSVTVYKEPESTTAESVSYQSSDIGEAYEESSGEYDEEGPVFQEILTGGVEETDPLAADYSVCAYADSIGQDKVTIDHVIYMLAMSKGWDTLAKVAGDKCYPQSFQVPPVIADNDLMYLYALATEQYEAAQRMIDDGLVCPEEV